MYGKEKEYEYYLRKIQLDKEFRWTKENVNKLHCLNDFLAKLQNQLIKQITHTYHVFSHLENEDQISVSSFLYYLLKYNRVISVKDLLECTERDFITEVRIILGDNIGEMQKSTHNKSDDTLIADMLEKRCDELNSHFK